MKYYNIYIKLKKIFKSTQPFAENVLISTYCEHKQILIIEYSKNLKPGNYKSTALLAASPLPLHNPNHQVKLPSH